MAGPYFSSFATILRGLIVLLLLQPEMFVTVAQTASPPEVQYPKHDMGLAVYQPDREAQVLTAVRKAATELAGPLTAEAVVRIFERIIDEARRAERQESERRHGV